MIFNDHIHSWSFAVLMCSMTVHQIIVLWLMAKMPIKREWNLMSPEKASSIITANLLFWTHVRWGIISTYSLSVQKLPIMIDKVQYMLDLLGRWLCRELKQIRPKTQMDHQQIPCCSLYWTLCWHPQVGEGHTETKPGEAEEGEEDLDNYVVNCYNKDGGDTNLKKRSK